MGRRYDLSKTKNTVTEIFKNNTEKFYNCKTKEELIDICHQLLDNADVDTEWTHEFFIRLGLIKSFEQARSYVYNAMLRGMGHGVIGYRRQYEERDNAELNEETHMPKSIHDLIFPRVEYKEFDKDGVQTFSLELDASNIYPMYSYVGSGENGYLLNLGKVSKDRYPLKCIVYVDGKALSCDSETFKRQAREVKARYDTVKKNISDAINNAASLNESMSSSEAEDFKKKLKAGEVKFKYMKKDGSERTAVGTLKPELMDLPEKKTSSDVDKASENQKKKRKLPADSVFYYDLEAKSFRSFKMANFVDYI